MDKFYELKLVALALVATLLAAGVALADDEGERSNPPVKHGADKRMPDTVIGTEKSDITLIERVRENNEYATWLRAVEAAGLVDTFADGTYTLFVPSEKAWATIPVDVVDWLMLPENKDYLRQVVNYTVYTGDLPNDKLRTVKVVNTLGGDVQVVYKNGVTRYGTGKVVSTKPLITKYGTVYTVDTVLLPKPVLTVLEDRGYTIAYEPGTNWGRVMSSARHQINEDRKAAKGEVKQKQKAGKQKNKAKHKNKSKSKNKNG